MATVRPASVSTLGNRVIRDVSHLEDAGLADRIVDPGV